MRFAHQLVAWIDEYYVSGCSGDLRCVTVCLLRWSPLWMFVVPLPHSYAGVRCRLTNLAAGIFKEATAALGFLTSTASATHLKHIYEHR